MNHGMPALRDMDAKRGPPALLEEPDAQYRQSRPTFLEACRTDPQALEGQAVVKGLISPADARIARESGVDGVIVSNHGGRQLDYTLSA